MSVQQFCLRWNNHQPNFISVCSSLLHNGTLVDVTLAAEGRQLQAHKIVLSACSSYFQTLFTTNPCQHPIVILKDVQYDDLKTMVDFMYYGEVNVSQEQLPHILKTAEMLKIKGLAEMPTDPANLTKSDSKSSNEPTELIGNANNTNPGNACGTGSGSSGGIGSSTSGSVSDSLWGSTESQFQQQQHHHHQQQVQQHQQQQHHHHQQQQQHHHQQQQNSQTQTTQQHGLLRRTPSPLIAGASPATRRKRLRKSSNNGSGDRSNSEDQHNSSLDTSNNPAGVSLSQMCQMSFSTNTGSLGIGSHSLQTAKLLKEASTTELEPHPQDSDSLEDGHGHVPMQIKPEVDISGVQSIPLDISGTTTPPDHDAPNSQSTHSELITSPTRSDNSIIATVSSGSAKNLSTTNLQLQQPQTPMGTKRVRVLIRQPRVKRDSDSLSTSQVSPEPSNVACAGTADNASSSAGIDYDPFSSLSTSTSAYAPVVAASNSDAHLSHHPHSHHHQHHSHHPQHHHLLSVPQRIERHSSEPAPSLAPSSPHLLSIPQSTPFLTKQLSDPLLPSQHAALAASSGHPFAPLHRQYSHPLPGSHITSAPLHHAHHISLPESIYASGSPPPAGSSQYFVPQQGPRTSIVSEKGSSSSNTIVQSMTPSSSVSTKTLMRLPQFTTTYVSGSPSGTSVSECAAAGSQSNSPPPLAVAVSTIATERHGSTISAAGNKLTSSKSANATLMSERSSLHPHGGTSSGGQILTSSSFEHFPTLRVKNEELQRSVSSPQTTREITTLENPRSSHCPVIRPGPALGCNFCWNTIDGHNRILRRKTKYHCPECQTNLCIVPCFQEYHERLNNESTDTLGVSNDNVSSGKHQLSTNSSSGGNASGSSGGGGGTGSGSTNSTSATNNSSRHYSKTESI